MSDEEVLGLLEGGQAAAERAEQEKQERAKKRSSSFNAWEYFRLAAPAEGELYGESKIIRVVTPEERWAEVKQHSYIPTKPAPADKPTEKKWMARFGAVCRYTVVPKKRGGEVVREAWYKDCFICDRVELEGKKGKYKPKGTPRQWAWAVEREEVLGTQEMADAGTIEPHEVGDVVGYRDVMVEHTDKDGNTSMIQKWVVLNFASDNFFDYLLGYNNVYKTVVDRDYKVTRVGGGTDTDYSIVALDPMFEEVDGKRVKYDLRRPEIAAKYQPPVALFDIIKEQASDDHYDWFFNTDVESSWVARYGNKGNDDSDAAEGAGDAATSPEDTQHKETLNAMRERLKASKAKATASA